MVVPHAIREHIDHASDVVQRCACRLLGLLESTHMVVVRLREQHRLDLEPVRGSVQRRGCDVMSARASEGEDAPIPASPCVAEQKLELTHLVAAEERR